MTEEGAAVAAAQLADELRRAGESRGAAEQGARQGKAARAAEERARRTEQLRKDSLGAVYRRLVKELHPDLESDAAERERKSRIMRNVTAAYTRGDLHALLQLELEYLIGQLRPALERFSSGEALQEVRGAIREYRDSEKGQLCAGRGRR